MKKKTLPLLMLLVTATLFAITYFLSDSYLKTTLPNTLDEVSDVGICPPYHLLTADGDTINPKTGQNIDKPYSPKQTCGRCHDYETITMGYHFQQGKDEMADTSLTNRAHWVTHAGNYGGNWCSPAPLYAYLSKKENTTAKTMDLTSYSFVQKCGVCHPGGGPLEYDRDGLRYDQVMLDSIHSYSDGTKNNLDGDYYKAKWQASGVVEADCYICHLPGYDNKKRVAQIKNLNYKYAALAGSGFGEVSGSVSNGEDVNVSYRDDLFNGDGTVEPNISVEPENKACLWCHAKPGYKKRGADYNHKKDVHLNAGLLCVDCHTAGSRAHDTRINGKEMHQIAKGNDPGGMVRNDLDNTMRTCAECHDNGYKGAPLAEHNWLPSLHLDKLACQTCHVPERNIKSAHYVASDVYNPGTKIPTKGKHLWTFYGPDMNYWNHYGDLETMGYDHKPNHPYKPEYIKYDGKIRPANRVHTSWPAILESGEYGLMQPKMGDVYKMWKAHQKDASSFAELSNIKDNNGDKVIEINHPEEIDALIASVSKMLEKKQYPMDGKQVVWVMNNRVYKSGSDFYEIPMEQWQASPYGNVHTYNHDILPARSAIGSRSCTECHSTNSELFYAQVLKNPVGPNGQPEYQQQYEVLGMAASMVWLSVVREQFVKTLEYPAVLFLLILAFLSGLLVINKKENYIDLKPWHLTVAYLGLAMGFVLVYLKPDLNSFILPSRMWFDRNHFIMGIVPLLLGGFIYVDEKKKGKTQAWFLKILAGLILLAMASGIFMLIKFDAIEAIVSISYTLFDVAVVGITLLSIGYFVSDQLETLNTESNPKSSI